MASEADLVNTTSREALRERLALIGERHFGGAYLGMDEGHGEGTGAGSNGAIEATLTLRRPILSDGESLGVLVLRREAETPPLSEDDVLLVEMLVPFVAAALAHLERADAQEALDRGHHLSGARFHAVFAQLPFSMQIFDAEGHSLDVNQAWQELFRLPLELLPHFNPLHDPQLEDVRAYLERGFAGETVTIPAHLFDPGAMEGEPGRPVWLEVTVCPVRDDGGAISEVIVMHRDVTAQQETEEALRASEASYRTLFDLASDAIFVHDIETGEILDANQKACELHGSTLDELKALGIGGISDGTPPYDAEHAAAYVRRAAAGEPQRFEWLVRRRADGAARIWVEVSLHRVEVLGQDRVLASVRNIDERKQAEEALRERERVLCEAQRLARVGSWTWDVDSDRVTWSDELYRIYGLAPHAFGASFAAYMERVHPDDRAHVRAHIEQAVASGEPFAFEERIRRPDGGVRVLRSAGEVMRSADGRTARLLGVCHDVTEWKEAEAALQQAHAELEHRVQERTAELARAEQRFRAIVEASPTPLLLSHATDGVVLYANDRLEALIGVPPGSLVGRRTPDFYYDLADRTRIIQAVQEQGYARDLELRITRSDGTPRWVSLTTQRLIFNGEPTLATALVDITERKEAEAALRERTEELEAIFRALPDLYFRMQADGVILAYRAGRAFGLFAPPDEFMGHRVQDVLPPPVGEQVGEALAEVARTGDLVRIEYMLPLEDDERFFEARLLPIADDQVIAVVRDVTEPKRAQAAILDSEASYRGLFDTLTELVYIQDLEGRFINVNEAVVHAYGYDRSELIGQTPEMLGAPGTVDPAAFAETFAKAVAGHPQRFEWWGRRKDGSIFPKEVVIQRSTYFGQEVIIAVARDVTIQKEAEAALRASEEHFRRLIENASDIITIIDAEGRVRYQSPAIARILGYDPSEFTGQSVFAYFHPDDVAGTAEALKRVVEEPGRSETAEFRFRHKDGSWRVLEGKGATVAPDSAADGVVVNSRDITERKEAEAELMRQRAYFEEILDSVDAGIAVFDAAGRHEYVSPKAMPDAKMRRWMIGKTMAEYARERGLKAEISEARQRSLDQALATRTPNEFEQTIRTPDGDTRYMLRRLLPMLDEAGEVERLIGYSVDITERKKAEETLRLQKTLLEAQGEASIDGILVISEEGRMLSYNRRFVEMWGIPEHVLASASDEVALQFVMAQLVDPASFVARVDYLYAHPDEVARDEVALRDGRILDRYSAPVCSKQGDRYGRIWFFRDITEQKRHAADLEAARQEARQYAESLERSLAELQATQVRLVQQEKMASLGRLTSGIAHEIKNPLNFVTNFAELNLELVSDLRRAVELGDDGLLAELLSDVESNTEKIAEHGERADSIVKGMMEHARIGSEEREARRTFTDLNKLIQEQLLLIASERERVGLPAVDVDRQFAEDLGDIHVAPHEISRVIHSLLKNALEAVDEWGAGGAAEDYAPKVVVRTHRDEETVGMTISDNGPGIVDALRNRVFEPFFSTKPAGSGHPGLGLSLAHDIVVVGYGGWLDLESVEGEGATFTMRLPVQP